MAEYDKAADVLEKLIETCRDGENGYRDAAEHVKSADLKTLFREKSAERARFATELEGELERMGRPKTEKGSWRNNRGGVPKRLRGNPILAVSTMQITAQHSKAVGQRA